MSKDRFYLPSGARAHDSTTQLGGVVSLALLLVAACSGASDGSEGEPCNADGTCNANLVCLSDLCVDLGDLPDADIFDAPADAQPLDAVTYDAAMLCNDDSEIEPNESIANATPTPIPDLQDFYTLANLAICPDTDVDTFRLRVDVTGKNLSVDMRYDSNRGLLRLDILNATGTSIAAGGAVMGDDDHLRAAINNLPPGIYHVQVRAFAAGITNNYDTLDIVTTGP